MKVLMLNTFNDVGGASRAAVRLQAGVRRFGVDSRLLVQLKGGDADDVVCTATPIGKMARSLRLYLGVLPVRLYRNKPENNFTPAMLPDRLPAEIAGLDADLLHLHWLGAGFCRIETLRKFRKPLVWTLHDSWPFTGGCHVPFACDRYRNRCGACPVLGSSRERDLSRWVWRRKEASWRRLNLRVVAPSRWLADCARASTLFHSMKVDIIPNGIDTERFRPLDKQYSRALLGLPQDRKIILYGAVRGTVDPNKGWHLLQPALQAVGKGISDAVAVIFGSPRPAEMPDLGMPAIFLGQLRDDPSLVAAYAAADVFVAPSIQESFCQTALEAMACGTPVVAFAATGLVDLVDDRQCGYLARPYDVEDLARGIVWVLGDGNRQAELAQWARQKVVNGFAIESVARRYVALYRELLEMPAAEAP